MYTKIVSLIGMLFLLVGCIGSPEPIKKANINIGKPLPMPKMVDYNDPEFKTSKPFIQKPHSKNITYIKSSPDGKYVITASLDNRIKLWDAKTKSLIKTFIVDGVVISGIDFSPNGKYIVSFSAPNIMIWDVGTGLLYHKIQSYYDGILSQNGKYIYILEPFKILIFDISNKKVIKIIPTDFNVASGTIKKVTPDGKYLVIGSASGLKLIELSSGSLIRDFVNLPKGYSKLFSSIDISKDGKYLVSVLANIGSWSNQSNIILWDMRTGEKLQTFSNSGSFQQSIIFSRDDKNIIYSSWGRDNETLKSELKIINLSSSKILHKWKYKNYSIEHISVTSKQDEILVTSGINYSFVNINKGIQITDSTSTKYGRPFIKENENRLYFASDGKHLISINLKNLLDIKSINTEGQDVRVNIQNNELISYFNFATKEAKVVNLKTNETLFSRKLNSNIMSCRIYFSKNQKYILLNEWTSDNTFLNLYDLKNGNHLKKFNISKKDIIFGIEFLSDNNSFITMGTKSVKLFKTDERSYAKVLTEDSAHIYKVSPDKKHLIQVKEDSIDGCYVISIFAIKNERVSKKIKIPFTDRLFSPTICFDISFDSQKVFVSTLKGELKVYDLKSSTEIASLSGIYLSFDSKIGLINNDKTLYYFNSAGVVVFIDLKTKKEVLKIVSFSNGEWISITPDGYFNASANGAKYIKVLTGPMEVSTIDQYYETFYRPDIVMAAINSIKDDVKYASVQKVKPTIKLNDIKPAPEVTIVNTEKNIDSAELKVTIKITPKTKDEYGQIRLYLDGTLIKTDNGRALKRKESGNTIYRSYTLKVAEGEHTIKALVFNKDNTMQSSDALHSVVSTYKAVQKPNIYAVVIGINKYNNRSISLKYAVPDAKLFANTIKKRTKGLFGKIDVRLLTTKKETSKANITKTLKSLQDLNPNDMFIFYVASHGMIEDAKYHMITSNVGALSSRGIKREAISQEVLKDLIANIPTTKKFIILDTCNSGALGQALEVALLTRGLSETTAMKVLSRAVGSTIISASSSTQEALEGYRGHGLLTYVLSQGLNGEADSDSDGYIKTLEIANFVEDTVPEIAEREFKRAQYPYVSPLGQGFPLVKIK